MYLLVFDCNTEEEALLSLTPDSPELFQRVSFDYETVQIRFAIINVPNGNMSTSKKLTFIKSKFLHLEEVVFEAYQNQHILQDCTFFQIK